MFKFLKDLFSTSPTTSPHPLDGPTRIAQAQYKVEPPPGLEIVAEPATVVVEATPAPKTVVQLVPDTPKKKAKNKPPVPAAKKPAAKKIAGKNPRGRKPKDQQKKSK